MHRIIHHVIFAIACLATSLAHAQNYRVGDKVVVISNAKLYDKTTAVGDVFQGQILPVIAVEGKWIQLNNGKPGWMNPKSVAPLDRRAADRFTALLEKSPFDTGLYFARSGVWVALGELDNAIADCNEAIRIDPKSPGGYGARGTIWGFKGDHDKAIADFGKVLQLDPRDVKAYTSRAIAWSLKGDLDQAIADVDEVLKLAPKDAGAFSFRGNLLSKKGDYAKALADFSEVIRIQPKDPVGYNSRAWLLATCPDAQQRDGVTAVTDAKKACELTTWKHPTSLDTLAAAYAEIGDFPKAVETQQKAIDLVPKKQQASYQSRLELYRSGKPYRRQPQIK